MMPSINKDNDLNLDFYLLVDGGKSKTEAVIIDSAGLEIAKSRGPGLEIIGSVKGYERVVDSLRATFELLPQLPRFAGVAFGLNGAQAPSASADLAAKAISSLVKADRFTIASDVVMNYLGALGNQSGIVVAAGTGSVVMAISRQGVPYRIDGDGPLFADRGSGHDIGRQGLKIAAMVDDGLPGSTALHKAMIQRFSTLENTAASVYGAANPIELVASFSKSVAEAAEAGDEISIEILRCAAKDLALNVHAAARRSKLAGAPFSYSTAGGLFNVGPLLEKPFHDFIGEFLPEAEYQKPLGGAIAGARIVALNKAQTLEQVTTWVGAN
jgi:N-acetylglucosamine kinase-like BadF-type ATPase